ncbi:unnamed protein product [Rotaria sp. Silwood2]|nr:unnamed protein product [Rotaria sp. Silwood2]CAF3581144.1 unnamed protein product [Rotaria sp. Silwood2]CAF4629136.1 unnamed protein product [Rotaria sp. Silwood2]CAF4842864.1 unnamed protein product [Rotaria sp. Silwood2]
MLNENRGSDCIKRQSRRRTLLCYSTLCLFSFLILFLLLSQVFDYRYIHMENNLNKSISLNLMKFRSSLIQCGQSVVEKDNIYQIIEQLTEIIKNLAIKQKTKQPINIYEQLDKRFIKEDIIIWLEFILAECFQARQFSIIEQKKPTIIRKIISTLRKEFLYIAGFFLKET